MNKINIIIDKLEKEISKNANLIGKIMMATSLTKIIDLITKESIWELTEEDLKKLNNNLNSVQKQLTSEEIEFLEVFVKMPKELKALKKNWGLGIEQEQIIENINIKIKEYQKSQILDMDISKLEETLKQYKTLYEKFKNNDMNIITEIDLISNIANKYNIPFSEQIQIYKEINKLNNEIFRKYNVSITEQIQDEEELSENDLIETNLSEELLQVIFEEFNINWQVNYDEETTEASIKNKEEKLQQHKLKLLKYGKFEKIREILQYLKKLELTFVFDKPEILTNTLLFSSKSQIEKLITLAQKYNMDIKELITNDPQLLYPTLKDIEIKVHRSKGQGNGEKNYSGHLKHFVNCAEFLESQNFDVELVLKKCQTLFTKPIKTIKKAFENLKMYGISLDMLKQKKAFSVLCWGNVLNTLDVAIESNCLDYVQENLSKLNKIELLYKVKYAMSIDVPETEIFRTFGAKKVMYDAFKKNKSYGNTTKEIFEKYNAHPPQSPNKDFYDSVIKTSDVNNISTLSLNDSLIEKIDSMYHVENSSVYNFDGVIISRFKVLRYYEALIKNPNILANKDVLMYAITALSMLNKEEYDKIKGCIDKIKFKGSGIL